MVISVCSEWKTTVSWMYLLQKSLPEHKTSGWTRAAGEGTTQRGSSVARGGVASEDFHVERWLRWRLPNQRRLQRQPAVAQTSYTGVGRAGWTPRITRKWIVTGQRQEKLELDSHCWDVILQADGGWRVLQFSHYHPMAHGGNLSAWTVIGKFTSI